ncbi:hypothetical protein [Pedobacter frigiditerrae]|uniref:hypothetical protein n=1 Tax=Pedobacter frigiditerrae TaxID=2530452 RepID=UPI002930048E|nr:hypothetical protein [Pedobacter frigiditerrae]
MPQLPPIDDSYIDAIIKSDGPYNSTLNKTQGVKLRELMKRFRDYFEEKVPASVSQLTNDVGYITSSFLEGYAYDSDVLHRTGNETKNGDLTLNGVFKLTNPPVTDTSPTQILTRDAGTGIVKQIGASMIGSNLLFSGGLTRIENTVKLGGVYNGSTSIYSTDGGGDLTLRDNSMGPRGQAVLSHLYSNNLFEVGVSYWEGSFMRYMDNATGVSKTIKIDSNGMFVDDQVSYKGLGDNEDYSANKTDYSYVTKKMLNNVNALSASKLATPRKINGVDFDGTSNITIPTSANANVLDLTSTQYISGYKQFNNGIGLSDGVVIVGDSDETGTGVQMTASFRQLGGIVALLSDITSTFTNPVLAPKFQLSALNIAPVSSTALGTIGEIRITASYIYICKANNTWVRASLTTW